MEFDEDRAAYEAAVRGLWEAASALLRAGQAEVDVAATMVARRNALKTDFRRDLPDDMLSAIEARNLARYGNPLGLSAAALLVRYGTWAKVIDAACRPADLSHAAKRRNTPK